MNERARNSFNVRAHYYRLLLFLSHSQPQSRSSLLRHSFHGAVLSRYSHGATATSPGNLDNIGDTRAIGRYMYGYGYTDRPLPKKANPIPSRRPLSDTDPIRPRGHYRWISAKHLFWPAPGPRRSGRCWPLALAPCRCCLSVLCNASGRV